MASSLKYPEDQVLYFIRGDQLGLVSTFSSSSETRTSRKAYQAIDHSVTDGLLIHYYGSPKRVTAITDTPDVDNLFHSSIVDYVKRCLYMDKAGQTSDGGMAQASLGLAATHEKRFNDAVRRYGARRRSKTGGTRAVVPANFK
tara:strand:- start:716 stop:1144 length:429 start_codon:yes stop_codon:yes gene_type:complete